MKFDIIIIGGGVSSYWFLFLLSKVARKRLNIIWLKAENYIHPVNSGIIPILTLNGIKKGNSELGDLLYDSFMHVQKYAKNMEGFYSCSQYCLLSDLDKENEKFLRRHGCIDWLDNVFKGYQGKKLNSYIVMPQRWFNFIERQIEESKLLKVQLLDDLVIEATDKDNCFQIKTIGGNCFEGESLFEFCGIGSKFLPLSFLEMTKIYRNKVSEGIVFKGSLELGKEPFIVTQDKCNLIYNGTGKFQLGGVNPHDKENEFLDIINAKLNLDLTKIDLMRLEGKRDKGKKRLPLEHMLIRKTGVYYKLHGLYKNAWTIAPFKIDKFLRENQRFFE